MVRERDLARLRRHAAAHEPGRRDGVVRRAERPLARRGRRALSPAAPWTFVISMASAIVGGGRIPGSRRASIVLPAPGGPIISRLWPPAAAISSARARVGLAAHVGEVGTGVRRPWGRRAGSAGSASRSPRSSSSSSDSVGTPTTSSPSARAASGAFATGTSIRSHARARAASAIASAPRIGRISPESESSPQTASGMSASGSPPSAATTRHRDRQVEARARLAQRGRRKVHGDALLRELHARVRERRTHALARLAHRAVGQPDDGERRQPAAHVVPTGNRHIPHLWNTHWIPPKSPAKRPVFR